MEEINCGIEKRISRFYLFEKLVVIVLYTTFTIAAIGILLLPLLYNYIVNTLFLDIFVKIIFGSGASSIIIGIISGNVSRRCPVCKVWMTRIAPINRNVIYRCERHNIEVNTHVPNTTS